MCDADRVPVRYQSFGLTTLVYVCRSLACVVEPEPVGTEAVTGKETRVNTSPPKSWG